MSRRRRFAFTDSAQQIVGGFLLAGPFVVTEEVWVLAAQMTVLHGLAVVGIVFGIGYGALYEADDDRDPDREANIIGVPVRFISLMLVSFGSVAILAMVFTAPQTFLVTGGILEDTSTMTVVSTTVKAVANGAIFSVVGAATADSVF